MYKKRFARWDVRKNCSAEEKGKFINSRQQHHAFECPTSKAISNRKPIQEHKIVRYKREQVKHRSLVLRKAKARRAEQPLAPASDNVMSITESISRRQPHRKIKNHDGTDAYARMKLALTPNPSNVFLSQSTECRNTEVFLHSTQIYYAFMFERGDDMTTYTSTVSNFVDNIYYASINLSENTRRAFTLLQRACDALPAVIREPCNFLFDFLGEFSRGAWKDHRAIKREILLFMAEMAMQLLGKGHILSTILELLTRDGLSQIPIDLLGRSLLDSAFKCLRHRTEDLFLMQLEVARALIVGGNLDAAERIYVRLKASAEELFPEQHELRRKASFFVGEVFWRQYRDDEAMAIFQGLIEDAEERFDDYSTLASRYVGSIFEAQRDLAQSEKYFRLSVENSLQVYGAHDGETLRHLEDLDRVLEAQGKKEEVQQLRTEYGHIWEYWENLERANDNMLPSIAQQ